MYDASDSSCGKENEMDGGNYSMSDALEENTRDKLYKWISDKTNGKIDIVQGNNIFIYQRMDDRGGLFRAKLR